MTKPKPRTDRQIGEYERLLGEGDTSFEVAEGIRIDYAPRPVVDRAKLLKAVQHHQLDQWLAMEQEDRLVSPEQVERWRTLGRLYAIEREVGRWVTELRGPAPIPLPGDEMSRPMSKAEIFRIAHPGKQIPHRAAASAWFRAHKHILCPSPDDPKSSVKVRVNVRLCNEWLGWDPKHLR